MRVHAGFVQVDGIKLHYEESGAGPVVVLLHPGFLDKRMWDREAPRLAEKHRVIRYDARGYGKSGHVPGLGTDAQDLQRLLKPLGIPQAFLVGISNGARIALDFAVSFPGSVSGLFLASCGLPGFEPSGTEAVQAFDELESRDQSITELVRSKQEETAIDRTLELWCPAVPAATKAWLRGIIRDNLDTASADKTPAKALEPPSVTRLGEVDTPTTVVWGTRDLKAFQMMGEALAKGVKRARSLKVAGADHLVNLSRPEEFSKALDKALGA